MLSLWDLLGIIVLATPLFVVLMGLVYIGFKVGISDWRRRSKEPKRHVEIGNHLLKYESAKPDVQYYLEEIKILKDEKDGINLHRDFLVIISLQGED